VTAGAYWQSARWCVAACGEQSHHAASATLPWSSAHRDHAAMVSSIGSLPAAITPWCKPSATKQPPHPPWRCFDLCRSDCGSAAANVVLPTPDSSQGSASFGLPSSTGTTARGNLVGPCCRSHPRSPISVERLLKVGEAEGAEDANALKANGYDPALARVIREFRQRKRDADSIALHRDAASRVTRPQRVTAVSRAECWNNPHVIPVCSSRAPERCST
jgi:hypothetical protein